MSKKDKKEDKKEEEVIEVVHMTQEEYDNCEDPPPAVFIGPPPTSTFRVHHDGDIIHEIEIGDDGRRSQLMEKYAKDRP